MPNAVLAPEKKTINKNNCKSKVVRIIDLFAGIGGMRLGFEQASKELGIKTSCVFSSEIKDYAIEVYKQNFGDNSIQGDITKVENSMIPDFDFLLAGFPCQPFSYAGKGLGFEDTRGTLFFEIERILEAKRPQGFLLENVEGLVTHNKGKTLNTIIDHLKNLGYYVNWQVLDAKDFGVPQTRKRIYIVGSKRNKINLEEFETKRAVLGEILEHGLPIIESHFTQSLLKHYTPDQLKGKAIKDKRGGSENIHSWDIELRGSVSVDQKKLLNLLLKERRKKKWAEIIGIEWMDGMPLTKKQIKTFFDVPNLQNLLDDLVEKGYLRLEHPRAKINNSRLPDKTKSKGYNIVAGKLSFEFTKILNPLEIAPTLVAMDVSHIGVIDNTGIRRLSIKEGLRLCGYPENYNISTIKTSEAFDLLGNTVCVPVIQAIVRRILGNFT